MIITSDTFIDSLSKYNLSMSDKYELLSFVADISYDEAKSSDTIVLDSLKCQQIFGKLGECVPVAYITNRREFYNNEFYVDSGVLIPRFETEILVEHAISYAKKGDRVLDLCTGSGAILISILDSVADISGVGVDVSQDALNVAKINSKKILHGDSCKFIKGDVLNFEIEEKFDILTCNPPYICDNDFDMLEEQVKYEPRIALTCGDSGLIFYKKLLSNLDRLCKIGSVALFEIGINQAEHIADIANSLSLKYNFIKDYAGIDRVLIVRL